MKTVGQIAYEAHTCSLWGGINQPWGQLTGEMQLSFQRSAVAVINQTYAVIAEIALAEGRNT